MAGGKEALGVPQLGTNAEGTARGIKDSVDGRDLPAICTADRFAGDDVDPHAQMQLLVEFQRQESLDVQRIELGDGC